MEKRNLEKRQRYGYLISIVSQEITIHGIPYDNDDDDDDDDDDEDGDVDDDGDDDDDDDDDDDNEDSLTEKSGLFVPVQRVKASEDEEHFEQEPIIFTRSKHESLRESLEASMRNTRKRA
ncbi:hypothetical protein HZH66_010882 [Vespula vulgaris]|uniref:Uncharacterized protein n=1 Tax=Vespula vulgaris TaxID=7454 RepID=A0A834MXG7_VESVU|nr:hypothetical protein HZH66_010882 [Vespula vulgaris]